MSKAVLLDRNGAVEGESTIDRVKEMLSVAETPERQRGLSRVLSRLEESYVASVKGLHAKKDNRLVASPQMSSQSWVQNLNPYANLADGAQVLNSTTETIMVPDYTLPANFFVPGAGIRYTLLFDTSTVVTTPGTLTFRLRYGGVAGTTLATSAALAPKTTVSTNFSGYFEMVVFCRTRGATGTVMAMGKVYIGQTLGGAADVGMFAVPQVTPATATIDTTGANAITPTIQFSVSTATTQLTTHIAVLESLGF